MKLNEYYVLLITSNLYRRDQLLAPCFSTRSSAIFVSNNVSSLNEMWDCPTWITSQPTAVYSSENRFAFSLVFTWCCANGIRTSEGSYLC